MMKTTELVTFIVACLGAVLGIINTWYVLRRDRVKLGVEAIHTVFEKPSEKGTMKLGLRVVNRSLFPITVSFVGFNYSVKGFHIMHGTYYRGNLLPFRLAARSAHTFYVDPPEELWGEQYGGYSYAYASTACGRTFRGRYDEPCIGDYIQEDFDTFIAKQEAGR